MKKILLIIVFILSFNHSMAQSTISSRITQIIKYDSSSNNISYKYDFEYNTDGLCNKITCLYGNGEIRVIKTIEYLNNKIITTHDDGDIINYTIENGKVIGITSPSWDGEIFNPIYDSNNHIQQGPFCNASWNNQQITHIDYNEHGDIYETHNFTYSNILNNANIDLNCVMSRAFNELSFGDDYYFNEMSWLGYGGCRTDKLISSDIYWDSENNEYTNYFFQYETDNKGRTSKIIETRDNKNNYFFEIYYDETYINGLENIIAEQVLISTDDKIITIKGSTNDSIITIYNLNGQCVYHGTDTIVSVNTKGMYIIRIDGKFYKVII